MIEEMVTLGTTALHQLTAPIAFAKLASWQVVSLRSVSSLASSRSRDQSAKCH